MPSNAQAMERKVPLVLAVVFLCVTGVAPFLHHHEDSQLLWDLSCPACSWSKVAQENDSTPSDSYLDLASLPRASLETDCLNKVFPESDDLSRHHPRAPPLSLLSI